MIYQNRRKVVKLRKKFPCMKMAKIAEKVGISRERVRQILKTENMKTRSLHFCKRCGIVIPQKRNSCGRIHYNAYCSPECRHKDNQILVYCVTCGKIVYRSRSTLIRTSHTFCSRACLGEYLSNRVRTRLDEESDGSMIKDVSNINSH